jgi:hypothetical protein
MTIDDLVLPAVADLTGPVAIDVLRPVVEAAGGTLHEARCVQVHYAPGRELVGRYECDVSWPSGRVRETLLAATTRAGPLPGAIAVTAEAPSGPLDVSVWRWPFDPVLTGLSTAVTPALLSEHLAASVGGPVVVPRRVEVVAYRPTERAVVRVTDASGSVRYLKVLPPAAVPALVERHRVARTLGVAAPEVLAADAANGLVLLAAISGPTLREHCKAGGAVWPRTGDLAALLARLHDAGDGHGLAAARSSRTVDALAHARFLHAVVPGDRDRLCRIEDRVGDAVAASVARSGPLVHGDLHEGQLFIDAHGAITGLIDLDDLGPGDPLDDYAVLLGHLEYRVCTAPDPLVARRLRAGIASLRAPVGVRGGVAPGGVALDRAVAAVLVGLATGPFRSQAPNWPVLTRTVLDTAERYLAGPSRSPAGTTGSAEAATEVGGAVRGRRWGG